MGGVTPAAPACYVLSVPNEDCDTPLGRGHNILKSESAGMFRKKILSICPRLSMVFRPKTLTPSSTWIWDRPAFLLNDMAGISRWIMIIGPSPHLCVKSGVSAVDRGPGVERDSFHTFRGHEVRETWRPLTFVDHFGGLWMHPRPPNSCQMFSRMSTLTQKRLQLSSSF